MTNSSTKGVTHGGLQRGRPVSRGDGARLWAASLGTPWGASQGAIVKVRKRGDEWGAGVSGRTESGGGNSCRSGFCPSHAPIIRYFRALNCIREGDDPELRDRPFWTKSERCTMYHLPYPSTTQDAANGRSSMGGFP